MLVKRIRQNLAERGWTLIHYDAAMLQGHQDYRAMARQARYRLILSGTPVGACRSGQPSFLYNLAIIENHTGTVALALSGVNCLDPIIQRFAADLDQKQVVPSIFKQSSSSPPSPAG